TSAPCQTPPYASDKALRYVDVISLNVYYGWYSHWGDLEAGVRDMLRDIGTVHREHPDKPIVITEFGAGAIAGLHSDPPLMWTEEYQAEFLRRYIEELVRRDYIQGLHIWNFADFRAPENPLRTVLNRKGVFTRDRQPKLSARVVGELFSSIPTFR
ncbi:MAG: glycoside hydrolase family 2 protein, partial [Thermoprotei archaeon]